MSTPFIGSLMSAAFNFPPKGWALCNGQTIQISQNQALFSLLGTTFGGNGQTTFLLPDLRSRTPISFSSGYTLGTPGGEEHHTLSVAELPGHSHNLTASGANTGLTTRLSGNSPAVTPSGSPLYGPFQNTAPMNPAVLAQSGNSQAHENRQPFLVINWVIALTGIFPTRS